MRAISDTLRKAIDSGSVSRYRIAQDTGIAESTLSRFVAGAGLNSSSLDRLAVYLGFELKPAQQRDERRGR